MDPSPQLCSKTNMLSRPRGRVVPRAVSLKAVRSGGEGSRIRESGVKRGGQGWGGSLPQQGLHHHNNIFLRTETYFHSWCPCIPWDICTHSTTLTGNPYDKSTCHRLDRGLKHTCFSLEKNAKKKINQIYFTDMRVHACDTNQTWNRCWHLGQGSLPFPQSVP